MDNVDIALIGVNEYRNSVNYVGDEQNLNEIRQSLYALYPGNWTTVISDLGDLILGEDVTQTYSRLISLLNILNEKRIIPIIIGGSQDLVYANYRAYDDLKKTVNIVNIDSNFDLGDSSKDMNNMSYSGKKLF